MSKPQKRRPLGFVSLVAAITAFAVMASSTILWFAVFTATRAEAGTVSSLSSAGEGGSWHSVDPIELVRAKRVSAGTAISIDASPLDDSRSWFMQVTVEAAESDVEVRLFDSRAGRPSHPMAIAPAGQITTTSTLIALGDASDLQLKATADAVVSVTAFAWLQNPDLDSQRPSPGGSVAVTARAVIDTDTGLGGVLDGAGPMALSPRGLGEVPSDGVGAVWLQLGVYGVDAGLALGATSSTPVITAATAASALVLAPLDENGLLWLEPQGEVTRLTASIVGWLAAQDVHLDAATITGGIVPLDAAAVGTGESSIAPSLPAYVPRANTVALYSVEVTAVDAGEIAGASDNDALSFATPGLGHTTSLVTADVAESVALPRGAVDGTLTLLGYFPQPTDAALPLTVEIDTPAPSATVDLADAGGTFVIEGRLPKAEAGISQVDVMLGSRYIGAATVRVVNGELHWSIETSAPGGEHEVTVRATDQSGQQSSAAVTFTVVEPPRSEPVAAGNVVVMTDAQVASVVALTPDTVTMDAASPAAVGDILAAPSSPTTPEGMLRLVLGIERLGDTIVLRTRQATLTEAILQLDYASEVESLVDPSGAGYEPVATGGADEVALVSTQGASRADQTQLDAKFIIQGKFALELEGTVPDAGAKPQVASGVSFELEKFGFDDGREGPKLPTGNLDGCKPGTDDDCKEGQSQVDLTATLGAEVHFTYRLRITAKVEQRITVTWHWLVPLPELELYSYEITRVQERTIDVLAYFSVATTAATGIDKSKGLGPDGKPLSSAFLGRIVGVFPTPIPIPWTLSFWLRPELSLSFEITGKFSQRFTDSFTDTAGMKYERGRLSSIVGFDLRTEASEITSTIAGSVSLTAGLFFDAMFYEILGLYLGVEGTFTYAAELNSKGMYKAELSTVLAAIVGAKLEILQQKLLDGNLEFIIWEGTIWSTEVPERTHDPGLPPDPSDRGSSAVGNGNRPLVVVFDLSGSMAGQRLEKAKDAIRDVVFKQFDGAELGVWTYPDGGGCGAGGFAIPVQPVNGTGELMNKVDPLQAGGQTPTGEALLAVTAALEAEGHTGATLILVSDGESNCAASPCDVAQQIVARGFELQVDSVGFQISSSGKGELDCIAAATGGSSVNADDEDALQKVVGDLAKPSIEISVSLGAPTVLEDRAQSLEVTVVNTSGRDVSDVSISIAVTDGTVWPVIAPAPPAPLGNLLAGTQLTRTFSLYSSNPGETGTVGLRVVAYGSNVEAVFEELSYSIVDEIRDPIEPGEVLDPDGSSDTSLVLVGDGFASGAGGGDALDDDSADECQRTDAAFASEQLDLGDRVVLACDGASSADVIADTGSSGANQLNQLLDLESPGVVIVSLGASDIGLEALLAQCALSSCSLDDPAVLNAITVAQQLDLSSVYEQLWLAANAGGTGVPVIVTAYPELFGADRGLQCTATIGPDEIVVASTLIRLLNVSLELSVERAVAKGFEVYFSSAPATALEPNHSLCSDDPYVTVDDAGRFALTPDGHALIADALVAWSHDRERISPSAAANTAAAQQAEAAGDLGQLVSNAVTGLFSPRTTITIGEGESTSVVKAGQAVTFTGEGYEPGTAVTVALSSGPTVLGTAIADENGRYSLDTVIPHDLGLGEASVTALGVSSGGGGSFSMDHSLAVAAAPPLWVALLALASLLLGLAGLVLVGVAFVRWLRRPVVAVEG
jgi:hypothetical protein